MSVGQATSLAGIDLGFLYPIQQPVRRTADLGRDRLTDSPAGGMIGLVIQYQPYRTLAHLRGKLVRRFARYGSLLLEVGASGKPGAVQYAV